MVLYIIGFALVAVGVISFWSAYAHFLSNLDNLATDQFGVTPKYAWCLYAGLPFVGAGMAIRMYVAGRDFRERRKKDKSG